MNKNSIIGFILIAGIMVLYTVLTMPSEEDIAKQQRAKDSIATVQRIEAEMAQRARGTTEDTQQQQQQQIIAETELLENNIEASDAYSALQNRFSLFANAARGERDCNY